MVRPGSSTNATLRDARSRANDRAKKKNQRRSNDNRSDLEIELNSLERDSHNDIGDLDDDDSYRYGARVNGAATKKQGGKANGYHAMDSKRREILEDLDRSRLQLGTDEDNSQIKLIPKESRGSDSNLQASDIGSKMPGDIELASFDPEERSLFGHRVDISQTELVQILEQTLYQYYLIDSEKFNVRKILRKLDPDLVMRLEARIKFKVTKENRSLKKIYIDFGPYPLSKSWQIKKKEK